MSKQDVPDAVNGLKKGQPTVEPRAANTQQVEAKHSDGVRVGKHDVESLAVDKPVQPSYPDGLWVGELDLGSLAVIDQPGASRSDDMSLGELDSEFFSMDPELEAGFSRHEDEQHDVKPLLGEDAPPPSAASVVGSDDGEEVNGNIAVVNKGPARGSEEERQMMARLSEIESGPAREANDESEGGPRGSDGGPWWEWVFKIIIVFLITLNICTMVYLDVRSAKISRGSSVVTANTTTTTATITTTVPTTTGLLSFTKAMNSLVERTGAIASYLTSTGGTSGDGNANKDISSNSDDNENSNRSKEKDKDTNKNKDKNKNKNKNTKKNKGKSQNKHNEDDGSASSGGGNNDAKTARLSSQSGERGGQDEGRLHQRWKAWASEFEDLVDGPWV